jgi:radical SAM superfamily enzyme YgiQ (UPF0313 family)
MQRDRSSFRIVLIALFGLDFGIYSLQSFLEQYGFCVTVIEFNHLTIPLEYMVNDYFTAPPIKHDLYPEKDLRNVCDLLDRIKPDIVGISVSSVGFQTARWMTRRLKAAFGFPIIWGGIHAILSPEDCIEETDLVCVGEGEYPMFEIAEALRSHQPIDRIANMWIRNERGIQKNPFRPLIDDLDTLPLPNRLPGENKYFIDRGHVVQNPILNAGYMTNAYPMMTSRGCMYACSFCSNSVIKKRYTGLGMYLRRRSVDNVLQELRRAVEKTAVTSVRFWDDVFTYDEEWIDAFSKRYANEVGRPFICYAHPKRTKPSVLEKLSDCGLIMIYVGIQSGSSRTNTTFFQRHQSNLEIEEFARYARSLQITPNYDVIVDNIYESDEDEIETVTLLQRLAQPYKVLFFSLCHFPKTPLTMQSLNEKRITEEQLEHRTAKAVNNFFLVLSLSTDKRALFWNCIKAMSVNQHFSRSWITWCIKQKIFRSNPILLRYSAKIWLLLFKRSRRMKQKEWLLPTLVEDAYLNEYIIWKGNTRIHAHNNGRYFCHPVPGDQATAEVRLAVQYNPSPNNINTFEGIVVELISIKETILRNRSVWIIKKKIQVTDVEEMRISFTEDRTRCFIEHAGTNELQQIRKAAWSVQGKHLFICKIKMLQRGRIIPFKINTSLKTQTLITL